METGKVGVNPIDTYLQKSIVEWDPQQYLKDFELVADYHPELGVPLVLLRYTILYISILIGKKYCVHSLRFVILHGTA